MGRQTRRRRTAVPQSLAEKLQLHIDRLDIRLSPTVRRIVLVAPAGDSPAVEMLVGKRDATDPNSGRVLARQYVAHREVCGACREAFIAVTSRSFGRISDQYRKCQRCYVAEAEAKSNYAGEDDSLASELL